MEKLQVKNLDQLYAHLKSEAGQLHNIGMASQDIGHQFQEGSLLNWFFKNISGLKAGCVDVLVAEGVGRGDICDELIISSSPVNGGLLVQTTRTRHWYGSSVVDYHRHVFFMATM